MTEAELLEFIRKESRFGQSQWFFGHNGIKVYIRNTPKLIDGKIFNSSIIANIEVRPRLRRQGMFSKTVQFIYEHTNKELVMIENVIEPIIQDWCIKNGWEVYYDPADDHDHLRVLPSYFKMKTNL